MLKRGRSGSPDRKGFLASLALAAVYLLLLRLSWRRSADPLLDFGREAYTAWRLSSGDLLYRDVASLFGPLAAYIDAAAFALLGPSLSVLFALNAIVIAVATVLVYRFTVQLTEHLTAFLAALTFLGVFAFGHLGGPNYNFLTPYSQAAVWGVVFGMAAISCLAHWLSVSTVEGSHQGWLFAAGLCLGFTFLTKPEIFVAVAGATVVALTVGAGVERAGDSGARESSRKSDASERRFLWLGAGTVVPLAVTVAVFYAAGSGSLGVEAALAAFEPLLSENSMSMTFYRHWAGLDDWPARILEILLSSAWVGGLVVGMGLVEAFVLSRASESARRVGRVAALVVVFAGIAALSRVEVLVFNSVARATPVLLLAGLFWCAGQLWRGDSPVPGAWAIPRVRGRDAEVEQTIRRTSTAALAVWIIFSLLLLLKLGFYPRFSHYGFYLAAPGGVAVVIVLVKILPWWIDGWMDAGELVRLTGIALTLLTVFGHALVSVRQFQEKDVRLAAGSDALWGKGPVAEAVDETLSRIEELAPPDATLAVLPEGTLINYWSRRRNPTRYVSFMPPELAFYGIGRMRRALRESRPDLVVLYERPLSDYGGGHYGDRRATGSEIVELVRDQYRCVERIPVRGWALVFEILQPRDVLSDRASHC